MKQRFIWAYKLSNIETEKLFDECQFFFDTNALLGIYKVRTEIAEKIIDSISKFKTRICVPYHVAEEYHKHLVEHHADRIAGAQTAKRCFDSVDKIYDNLFPLSFRNYLSKEEKGRICSYIKSFSNKILSFIREKEKEYNDEFISMNIASKLANELSDCILERFSDDKLAKLKSDFTDRVEHQIPPGYKDKNKGKKKNGLSGSAEDVEAPSDDDTANREGDYIIWEEILSWAETSKKDVILISNEEKTDWIWKEKGLRIGPRQELRKEFISRTGGKIFHIIKLDQFLTLSKDHYTPEDIAAINEDLKSNTLEDTKVNNIFFNDYLGKLIRKISVNFDEDLFNEDNNDDIKTVKDNTKFSPKSAIQSETPKKIEKIEKDDNKNIDSDESPKKSLE